jgi:hypothetical protein
MLARMAADRFMPVRREALYAMVDESGRTRTEYLLFAMQDNHASIRHAARFYLHQDAAQGSAEFDARAVYLNMLAKAQAQPTLGMIAGLGECGDTADADMLIPLTSDPRPSIAAAAVRAVAALDRDTRGSWFADLLQDSRPAIVKEASRALENCGSAEIIARVRTTVRNGPHAHSRRLSLRLLLRRHPYEAIVDAISATESSDAALAGAASDFIENIVPWRVSYGPGTEQIERVRSAISTLSKPLPDRLLKRVHAFMGMKAY